jgi:hypothetical protein
MPLHISEIGVRLAVGAVAAVNAQRGGSGSGPGPSGGARGGAGPSGAQSGGNIPPDKMEEIVSQSVQRVLEHLRAAEAR